MLGTSRGSQLNVSKSIVRTLTLLALASTLFACGNDGVGEPCIPETIPEGGFKGNENYVESSSVQCRSRICIVNQLEGEPADLCARNGASPAPGCANAKDDPTCRDHEDSLNCSGVDPVQEHVYCTCRCDGPRGVGFEYCDCPDGFECSRDDILTLGGDGIKGKYCVRPSQNR